MYQLHFKINGRLGIVVKMFINLKLDGIYMFVILCTVKHTIDSVYYPNENNNFLSQIRAMVV